MKKLRGFIFNLCGSYMEIKLTRAMVEDFPSRGQQHPKGVEWAGKLAPYFTDVPAEFIRKCIVASGAWTAEELPDEAENLAIFIEMAVGSVREQITVRDRRIGDTERNDEDKDIDRHYLWTAMEGY